MTLLSDLIESGIVSLEPHPSKAPRCRCLCGGECAVKSIHSHVHTKRHQKFLSQRNNPPIKKPKKKKKVRCERECSICLETKLAFFTCRECKNEHCKDCHAIKRTSRGKKPGVCPHCRAASIFREILSGDCPSP